MSESINDKIKVIRLYEILIFLEIVSSIYF